MTDGQDLQDESTYPSPQMPKSDITHLYVSSNNVKIQSIATINNDYEKKKQVTKPSQPPSGPQDIISDIIGDFGIWQLRTVLIIFLCKIPAAWFMACLIFTAPEVYAEKKEFQCDSTSLTNNHSVTQNQCYINQEINQKFVQEPCKQFYYNYEFISLTMQFDLVCLRSIFVAWTQYWHLFGVLVGGVLGSKIILWISPRNSYILSMIFQIILGIATGCARDLTVHCIFRFMAAVCCAIMFTTGQAIFLDFIGGSYRWGVVMLYDTFWSIGVILLPGVSSFFNHWTDLYLGISFPTFFLIMLLPWTPESPRWLLKNGMPSDIGRVERLLRSAAEINDRMHRIPLDLHQQLSNLRDKMRKAPAPASWSELWHGHYRAKTHMIASHLALAAYVVNFMGLLLNIRSFGREYRTISTISMGFCEIIGCFLAVQINRYHSKTKFQIAGFLNIIGGLIACLGWLFSNNHEMNPSLKLLLWLIISGIPKMTVAAAQSTLLAGLAELMPPNKKMTFVFSAVTWARIWLLTAPFINVLKKFDAALSLCFFGLVIIVGGISTCLLRPIPNSAANIMTPVIMQSEPLLEKHQSPLNTAVWVYDGEEKSAKNEDKV